MKLVKLVLLIVCLTFLLLALPKRSNLRETIETSGIHLKRLATGNPGRYIVPNTDQSKLIQVLKDSGFRNGMVYRRFSGPDFLQMVKGSNWNPFNRRQGVLVSTWGNHELRVTFDPDLR